MNKEMWKVVEGLLMREVLRELQAVGDISGPQHREQIHYAARFVEGRLKGETHYPMNKEGWEPIKNLAEEAKEEEIASYTQKQIQLLEETL